ncbi:MAG: prolipoprotein diacylglyceryl transferase [Nanoarchaeota archaeon]
MSGEIVLMAWVHNLNPTILNLPFGLEIRWYGLMYVLAFLFTYWYIRKRIQERKAKITEDDLDSILFWGVIALILGARLFDVFYSPSEYFSSPLKIFEVWKGGLSFHGGLLGLIIAVLLFCKRRKISFLHVADLMCVPLALGQAFGRLGNFFNGELYGGATNLPWGIIFPGTNTPRHPTMIYEALYDVVIFWILWKCKDSSMKEGRLFGMFLILYSIFRTLTEFLRYQETSWMWGPLSVAQWLNVPMLLAGVWLMRRK